MKINTKLIKFKESIIRAAIPLIGNIFKNRIMQLYINDENFKTFIYLNNFIKYFSLINVEIKITIKIYSLNGLLLKEKIFDISKSSSICIDLFKQFSGLDRHGYFTVSANINPRYNLKIKYLGSLSPQFMTVFVPRNNNSAPQMIHSHKRQQYSFAFKKPITRHSSHIENLDGVRAMSFYVLNSSRSSISANVVLICVETNCIIFNESIDIESYGTGLVKFNNRINCRNKVSIKIKYSHYLSHTKPIIFREKISGIISANHL